MAIVSPALFICVRNVKRGLWNGGRAQALEGKARYPGNDLSNARFKTASNGVVSKSF
jgi:hypothetical protein